MPRRKKRQKAESFFTIFKKPLHESLTSVLPIILIVLALCFTIAPVPGEPAKRPYEIAMKCWEKGFYVRYGGDTIQLAPPFISEKAEIDRMVNALGDALNETA